jgi:hypothetical protein
MDAAEQSHRIWAERLAQKLLTEDGADTGRLLRLTGLLGSIFGDEHRKPIATSVMPAKKDGSQSVGIWHRDARTGDFVRSREMLIDWDLWANVERISAKQSRTRVVLLGESTARGFLYDPQFSVAAALESALRSQMENVEVVDLARTNLGLEITDLAKAALILQPDVVVIFAGNNWGWTDLRDVHPASATIAAASGVPGLKRFIEARHSQTAEEIIRNIANVYADAGVPFVWVIPEFNLADWKDPVTNAPHLLNGRNREWLKEYARAVAALEGGDSDHAWALASKLIEIDEGTTVSGYYILAECSRRRGDVRGMRSCLESARDAVIWWDTFARTPRPYSVTRNTLRTEIGKCRNAQFVDLSTVFSDHLNGGIPGKELFLDYCHLTASGIKVAMAATATAVLRLVNNAEIAWRDLARHVAGPSADADSEAHFLAAIHNAHWHQPYDIVHHHCATALSLSSRIAQVMAPFIDLQTKRTPLLRMCKAAEQIAQTTSPSVHHYLFRFNHQRLDKVLLEAVANSLLKAGMDRREHLQRLQTREHSVSSRRINLLDHYYCSSSGQPQEAQWVRPRTRTRVDYYKAYWPESKFVFLSEPLQPVRLDVTWRRPCAQSSDTVSLEVNGQLQAEIAVGAEWDTWEVHVDVDAVKEGVNEVIVRWPFPQHAGQQVLDAIVDDIDSGLNPELFPVFGEIHFFGAHSISS